MKMRFRGSFSGLSSTYFFSSLTDNFCEKDELIGVKLSLVRSMKLFKDNSCEKMLSLSNALSLIKRNMLTKDNPRYLTTYSVNAEQRLRGTEVLLYVY